MTILVTGGAGFIGSHTCVELLNVGNEVIVFDNFSNSSPQAVTCIEQITGKKVTCYTGDIQSKSALDCVFSAHKIDAVIHFAGLKAVGESVQIPLTYYRNNVGGTVCLLEAMDKAGCKKIVFSSSATVYGINNTVPFKEDYPTSATNPYGYTKVVIENILLDLCASDSQWSVSLLRYFNPIGAHESGLIGENPKGIPNNLLPYISQVATAVLPQLSVYGDDYDTEDGTGVRDYLHVVDLALGHIKALVYIASNKGAQAINLGTGNGLSVLEIVKAFEKASGVKIPYKIVPRRAGDIATCYADASKAKQLLGWTAQRDIDKMCADSWKFTTTQKKANE